MPNSSTSDTLPLTARMAAFGCPNLVLLNAQEASPALVEYFDLLPRRGTGPQPLPVHAVAEHQGEPPAKK